MEVTKSMCADQGGRHLWFQLEFCSIWSVDHQGMLAQNLAVSTTDRINQGGCWLSIVGREQRIEAWDLSWASAMRGVRSSLSRSLLMSQRHRSDEQRPEAAFISGQCPAPQGFMVDALILSVWVLFFYLHVYAPCTCNGCRDQRRTLDPLELKL